MYYCGFYSKNIPIGPPRAAGAFLSDTLISTVADKSVKTKNTKIYNSQNVTDETIRLPSTNTRISGSFKAFPAWQGKNDHSKEPWI